MIKRALSIIVSTFMFMMCTIAVCFTTASAENESGSITLCCQTDEVAIEGMHWSLYRVGYRTADDYVFEGEFAKYSVTLGDRSKSLNEWDTKTLADAAEALRRYVIADKISGIANEISDANGNVTFANLESGLYLAIGEELYSEKMVYTATASFFEMSAVIGDNIKAYPKISIDSIPTNTGFDEAERYTVKKVWRNNLNQPRDRDIVIIVDIYRDNEFYEKVELSEKNDWKYQWTFDEFHEWFVVERDIPEDYTVSYRNNETQYLIVNTLLKTSNDESRVTSTTTQTATKTTTTNTTATSITTTISKLPQTGQLWWPVPIMAIGGIILLGMGFRLSKRDKQ